MARGRIKEGEDHSDGDLMDRRVLGDNYQLEAAVKMGGAMERSAEGAKDDEQSRREDGGSSTVDANPLLD